MTISHSLKHSQKPTLASSLSDWLNYMQHIHVSAIDLGLSRVMPVAHYLKLVESAKKDAYVFTVAGTNGKGSTTAVISEICQQAGYKTALYQSPHVIDFNERVRINGKPVGDEVLVQAFHNVEEARQACDLTLSFFEMTTLAAMLIFAQTDCEVWVLEVGLGGRLDVVNIIDPNLAVITNIGIDHVDWLGDTKEKIGFEKAGILRTGIPLIYGESTMPESVKQKAVEFKSSIFQIGRDYDFFDANASRPLKLNANSKSKSNSTPDKTQTVDDSCDTLINNEAQSPTQSVRWQFSSAQVTLNLPKPNLSLINVTNAVAAVLASDLAIGSTHIRDALRTVTLAGRFDFRKMVERYWLFDVAHNEHGMVFLLNQFLPLWKQHIGAYPKAKLHIIFSMLGDKNIHQVIELLVATKLPIENWHIAEINYPRAASLDELNLILRQHSIDNVLNYESLSQATAGVIKTSGINDLTLVCGSFHTISEVLQAL